MSRNKAYKILILILLTLQTYFFDLIPKLNSILTNYNTEFSKKFELGLFILLFVLAIIPNNQHQTGNFLHLGHFKLPLTFLLIGVSAIALASATIYHQTVYDGLQDFYGYYLTIGYFGLLPFFKKIENVQWFFIQLKKFGFVYITIQLVQGLIFKTFGKVILSYTSGALYTILTQGRFLEGAEFITFLAVVIAIIPFALRRNWNYFELTIIVEILLFHIFLSKGRMYLLIVLIVVILSAFFQLYSSKSKSIWIIFFPFIGATIVAAFALLIDRLNFTSGDRINSFLARSASLSYYSDHIFYNGWFGIGFPNSTYYQWLLKGTRGIDANGGLMTYADIGILGTIAILGCIGIIFSIWVLGLMIFACKRSLDVRISIILMVYVLVSCISLSPLDMGRVWPFILTLLMFDIWWRKGSDNYE